MEIEILKRGFFGNLFTDVTTGLLLAAVGKDQTGSGIARKSRAGLIDLIITDQARGHL